MERGVRKVRFKGAHGVELDARVDLPAGEPVAWALFAHCFTCSKDIFAASRISQALTDHGFAVLRFDFTGLGSSEGEFANTTFSSNVEDLVAAADWAREQGRAPSLLIGHSLGGTAVIRAAGQIPEVKAVATLNAPFCPEHVARLFEPVLEKIQSEGKAQVALGGRAVTITREFLEDISSQNMTQALRELRRALMIFHSPVDAVVDVENARQLYEAARHPKSFVSVDGADHLLTRKGDALFVAAVLGAWATRYLGTAEAEEGRALDPVAPEPGVVRVVEAGDGPYAQSIAVGRHRFRADEPESLGGQDTGPGPYDLLAAALGACTSMTVRMYAQHKKLELDHVEVQVRHHKVHLEDCEHCERPNAKIDRFERELFVEGELDQATRERLLDIANKCPVHRTLHEEVEVVTRLGERAGTTQG
jgi:uncharacterized OsmC-like protein/alpha/beta superfamily hydrolase